uniref:Uncharacterized protein n=1 Tax=Strongyloides papillosus TaxID=174720 RepID=A0A0N5CBV8_STREA
MYIVKYLTILLLLILQFFSYVELIRFGSAEIDDENLLMNQNSQSTKDEPENHVDEKKKKTKKDFVNTKAYRVGLKIVNGLEKFLSDGYLTK